MYVCMYVLRLLSSTVSPLLLAEVTLSARERDSGGKASVFTLPTTTGLPIACAFFVAENIVL